MSDTPRTDAALVVEGSSAAKAFGFVNADFARQLERELEDSNRLAASKTVKCCKYAAALIEIRDECFNGTAHDIAERALNDGNAPATPERDAALAWCEQLLQNLDLEHGERSRLQGIRDYILRAGQT